MISNQNLIYQFLTGQIKSIHIETWSPLPTPSSTSHFNNMPIQTEPDDIKQQKRQRQNNGYQKPLQPLMSVELDPSFHQQYNTVPQPVPLMSLFLPCYHSLPTESNNARMKLYSNKRIWNHSNHNPKHRQTYKPNPIFTNNTATNVRTTVTTKNDTNGLEDYETTSISYVNPHHIYTAVDTEMIELS
jgi:hypothetical protein